MKKLDLFSCPLWIGECELDRPKLGAAVMQFRERQMNNLASNIGGYQGIGFDKVIQKDQLSNGNVPVVIFTDPIVENEIQTALQDLKNHPVILRSKIIRIEDL